MTSPFSQKKIDLFCRVIDNLGDLGVCWRLARQLSRECGAQVQLIVDDLSPFSVIEPSVNRALTVQIVDGIQIASWAAFEAREAACDAELVIEAFACDPPSGYVASMAARVAKPLWINLEYLSAESWVDGVHGLPSPHPKLSLTKYFFVPGFTEKSGGLIRDFFDSALVGQGVSPPPLQGEGWGGDRAQVFHSERDPASTFPVTEEDRLRAFAFTYPHAPLRAFEAGFAVANEPLEIHVASTHNETDPAWLRAAPVPQTAFDELLSRFDVLLVRGEDSFLRAQYAAKPMLWHIYPTEDDAHVAKLDAWLDHYCSELDGHTARAMRAANHALVARADEISDEIRVAAFAGFAEALPALNAHALFWRDRLFSAPSLVQRLETFYTRKLA